jgi:DNA repair exonuclease SbcCD nuclease subunit
MGERCPNLKLFLQTEPQVIAGMVLLPCPLLRQRDSRSPADWLESLNWSALPQDQPRVVLAHGSVQGFGAEEQINQLHHNRWPEQEVDYIALGDWHALTQLNARAWYCGTPEPDRFPTSDQDQRSQALLVDLKRQQPPEVTPIPIGAISWHRIEAKVSSGADLQRLKATIESCVGRKVGKDLLRIELSGQLSFQEHKQLQQHLQDLEQQLLHLRIRGMPHRRPEPGEFQTFMQRDDAPLIQGITQDLASELEANSTSSADHEDLDRAMLEQAMLELQRIVLEEAEAQEASCG